MDELVRFIVFAMGVTAVIASAWSLLMVYTYFRLSKKPLSTDVRQTLLGLKAERYFHYLVGGALSGSFLGLFIRHCLGL